MKNCKKSIDEVLYEVGLEHNSDDPVKILNECQKRKLCIAIALIGNPKYIILDEPTKDLDLLSKRMIWDLLVNKKKDRVIFIITNDMNEANLLADRILILNGGRSNIQYHLDVESNDCNRVNDIIVKHIPECHCEKNVEAIIKNPNIEIRKWKLPISSTSKFTELFNELDSHNNENDFIIKYSLTKPTLIERYINLLNKEGKLNEKEEEEEEEYNGDDDFNEDDEWDIINDNKTNNNTDNDSNSLI